MPQTNLEAMRYCANTNLYKLKRKAIDSIRNAIEAISICEPIKVIEPKNYCDSDLDELFEPTTKLAKDKWWDI